MIELNIRMEKLLGIKLIGKGRERGRKEGRKKRKEGLRRSEASEEAKCDFTKIGAAQMEWKTPEDSPSDPYL